jgi:hypothetical protein
MHDTNSLTIKGFVERENLIPGHAEYDLDSQLPQFASRRHRTIR